MTIVEQGRSVALIEFRFPRPCRPRPGELAGDGGPRPSEGR
jgi:hypothetical protein